MTSLELNVLFVVEFAIISHLRQFFYHSSFDLSFVIASYEVLSESIKKGCKYEKTTLLSIIISTFCCCFSEVKGMEPLNNNGEKVNNLKTTRMFFLNNTPSANHSYFATDRNIETQTNNNLPKNLKRNANIANKNLKRKILSIRAKLFQIVLDEIRHKQKSPIETNATD